MPNIRVQGLNCIRLDTGSQWSRCRRGDACDRGDASLRPRPHQQQCRSNRQHCEATFDFVEATFDIVERIVQLVAFDNVASTLLLVWTGLKKSDRSVLHTLTDDQVLTVNVRSFVIASLLWTPALRPLSRSNAPAQGEEGDW